MRNVEVTMPSRLAREMADIRDRMALVVEASMSEKLRLALVLKLKKAA